MSFQNTRNALNLLVTVGVIETENLGKVFKITPKGKFCNSYL